MIITSQKRFLGYLVSLILIIIGCTSTLPLGPFPVSTGIHFHLFYPEAKTVSITGTFNNWDPTIHFLSKDASGNWSIILPLGSGRYEYLFTIDQQIWIPDPGAEMQIEDGFGKKNSLLIVE